MLKPAEKHVILPEFNRSVRMQASDMKQRIAQAQCLKRIGTEIDRVPISEHHSILVHAIPPAAFWPRHGRKKTPAEAGAVSMGFCRSAALKGGAVRRLPFNTTGKRKGSVILFARLGCVSLADRRVSITALTVEVELTSNSGG